MMTSGGTRHIESYGDHPRNVGEWFVPDGEGKFPSVVLVHGGFWRQQYDRSLEEPVATDLAGHGYLVWNIEYRSSAEPWPATLTDVAAAYDHFLSGRYADQVDRQKIAVVGHSAGGHIAAWLGSRHRLPDGAPGRNPDSVPPALVIPQGGVVALAIAADESLGDAAAQALLGGSPKQHPDRYLVADPTELVPTGVRSVLLHGASDDVVPVSQGEAYHRAARRAGDDCSLERLEGDHNIHLDPKSEACRRMRDALAAK
jgi:acetyl esterase/lipase